jgi:putative sterol carrier protein
VVIVTEKKYKFPSDEWIKAYMEELNKNKAYEEAARDWEGDFLFIITPDEELDKEYVFYVDLYHGKCREACMVPSREARKAAYEYEGPYSNWKKLITREIPDPIRALMTGQFKLRGDMARILRCTKAALELVKTAAKIPTEFVK